MLIFDSKAKEQDVIIVLRNASRDGKLGDFTLSDIKRTRSQTDSEAGTTVAGTKSPPGSKFYSFDINILVDWWQKS